MCIYHDELVNSANDNKVDNKFYFYFSEALNYKHYQAFFVFFLFVLHYAGLDFICQKSQFKQSQLELWGYIIKNITLSL